MIVSLCPVLKVIIVLPKELQRRRRIQQLLIYRTLKHDICNSRVSKVGVIAQICLLIFVEKV